MRELRACPLAALVALSVGLLMASDVRHDGITRIRAVGVADGVVTNVVCREGMIGVYFVLHPTPRSTIGCALALADPDRWDGRLWGDGNGGRAGSVSCPWWLPGTAAVHSDLGTSAGDLDEGRTSIDPEVLKDFGWRATHLMTVAAKRLCEAYYGRPPHHAYFFGESTGGGQGLCEAQRFPDDYDGIIVGVPVTSRMVLAAPGWRMAQLRRRHGKWFDAAEIAGIRRSELAYFATRDPAPARGRYIHDPEPTKEKLDGCWRQIVADNPALADREEIWRELFTPIVADGRTLSPGAVIGCEFERAADFVSKPIYGKDATAMTAAEMIRFGEQPDVNFVSPDLSAFARRGGRLITWSGLEDASIPPLTVSGYFDRVAETMGGAARVRTFYRHFAEPGRRHNGGSQPKFAGSSGEPVKMREVLIDWVENGVAPDRLVFENLVTPSEPLVVPAY